MSWRRILLVSLLFALLLGTGTWLFLDRADAVSTLVRDRLGDLLRPEVGLDGANIDVGEGRLRLRGLRVAAPSGDGDLLRLAEADCEVAFDPLGGLLSPHRISLRGLQLRLGPSLPAAGDLLEAPPSTAAGGDGGPAVRLPIVQIRESDVEFTLRVGIAPIRLENLELAAQPLAEEPGVLALEGSARLADLGATLSLTGRADLARGSIDIAVGVRDVPIDATALARLGTLFDLPIEDFEANCRLQRLAARLRIGADETDAAAPRFEVDGELAEVDARLPVIDYPLRGARMRLRASDRDGGTATVELDQTTAAGTIGVLATARADVDPLDPDLKLLVTGRDVAIDENLRGLLGGLPVGRRILAALDPREGRGDIDLFLHNPQRREDSVEMDLRLRGVTLAYHGFGNGPRRIGFPLPLRNAQGRVVLRDKLLHLEDVSAEIAAGSAAGSVTLSGRVDTAMAGGEEANLDIRAKGVPFGPELRGALGTLLHDTDLYDKLAPEGSADVEVLVRPRSQLAGGWAVNVRIDDAAVRWAGFPYRLEAVRGTAAARDAGVEFDLLGSRGGGEWTMRGRIPLAQPESGRIAGFEASVRMRDVPVDEELRRAAAVVVPELDTPWGACRPTGRLGGEVRVWRDTPEAELKYDLRVDCKDVRIELPAPPWYAAQLNGQVFAQGEGGRTRIDFDALRGRIGHTAADASPLAMLGSIDSTDPAVGTKSDLTFVVRDLPLDGQLGATLEALGAIGPGTWGALAPSGRTDLVCRHRHPPVDDNGLELVVQLLDVGSDAAILPRPARRMTGELTVRGGLLRFSDLRADLGDVEVRVTDGSVATRPGPDARTELAFTVSADNFPVDDGLAKLFGEPLQTAVRERKLSGQADVDALQLRFLLPQAGNALPFETTIGGQLRLQDVGVTLGTGREALRVDGLRGYVRLDESTVSTAGGGLRGALQGCSLQFLRHRLDNVQAGFSADARELLLHSLRADLDGGLLQNTADNSLAFAYLLPGDESPNGRLSANLAFERVDVFSFLTASGWTSPPYSGSASGTIVLDRLDGDDLVGATGRGDLTIERGDLGVVPLFTAIYAQLPAPERPRFHKLQSRFRLADRRVFFDDLGLWSNLLAAQGKDTLDLDGYLDVELKLDNLLGPSADPLLMPLVTLFTQNIVRFHLAGPLRDLRAEKRWVTEGTPRRREALPMPP
ncbi:MAG: hypothetical protein RL398_685, partial [Planctomycetota bacterium]